MAKRRGRGEGGLSKDNLAGRWVGSLDLGRGPDGKRRRVRVYGRTKTEARDKLAEARRGIADGMSTPDRRVTFDQLADEWLRRGLPADTAENTRTAIETLLRVHVRPRIGSRKLVGLNVADVEAVLDAMAAAGKAKATMQRVRSIIRRVLAFGVKRDRVPRNVAEYAAVPAGPHHERGSLTVAEGKALLAAARGDRLEALLVTGLLTGLRPGELLGLGWQSVNLDEATLTVERALRRTRSGLALVEPKTRSSVRRLDLPPAVVDALRAHRLRQVAERLAAGGLWHEGNLVFRTEVGTALDPSNVRRAVSRLGRRAGIEHLHPHLLRHSTASLLSAAGVPLESIADVLGHKSANVTAAVYRHRLPGAVSAGRDPMQQLFG